MTNPLWNAIGWSMLHYLWVGAVLGLIALAGYWLLRPATANLRYSFALGCLAALAIAPVPIAIHVFESSALQPTLFATDRSSTPLNSTSVPPSEGIPAQASSSMPIHGVETAIDLPNQEVAGSTAVDSLQVLASYLPWLWLLGAPMTFLVLATGLVGVERLRKNSRVLVDGDLAVLCQELSRAVGIRVRVAVGTCDRIATPILIGILRPMILLPSAAITGWTTAQIEMVLLHELSHVRRWDNFINLLQRIIESLLFFHPVVWVVSSWIRRERELCCDSFVVDQTGRARDYAEMLVTLAGKQSTAGMLMRAVQCGGATSPMAQKHLLDRIRHILIRREESMRISRKLLGVLLTASIATALLFGWYCTPSSRAEGPAADATSLVGQDSDSSTDAADANDKASTKTPGTKEPTNTVEGEASDTKDDSLIKLNRCDIELLDAVELGSARPGILESVRQIGERVKTGQIVASLRHELAEIELAIAESRAKHDLEVQYAAASARISQMEYKSALDTNKRVSGALTETEIMRKKLALEKSQLQLEQAKFLRQGHVLEAKQARERLKSYRVNAPFDGVVTQVFKSKGAAVTQGEPILKVVSTRRLRVVGNLDAKDRLTVKPGAKVKIQLANIDNRRHNQQETFDGRIQFVDFKVDPISRTVRVWAEVANHNNILAPGLDAQMLIYPRVSAENERNR